MKTRQNKTKFVEDFQKEYNEKVITMELAQLIANDSVLSELKLKKTKDSWGLIVITDSSVYFYKPTTPLTVFSIPIVSNSEEEEKDQIVKLSDLKGLCFSKTKTSFFASLFIPENSRTLDVTFIDSNNMQRKFAFLLNNKVTHIMTLLPTAMCNNFN